MKETMKSSTKWLFFVLISTALAGTGTAFALDFSSVTISCQPAVEVGAPQCGIRWGSDEQAAILPMTEQILDYLQGLDWKDNPTYRCEAKLGVWNSAGRQIFAIRNCAPGT